METREEHYASMMQAVQRYAPSADLEEIQKAYEYADRKHQNQLRKSGEPYIIHPLAVAEIVAEIGLDTDAIVAALLHDCLEDTDASFDEISHMFGQTVAELVEGVTKLTRVQYSTTEEQQMENLRKMFMAMSKDIRVILIKISDRLHNMRTLEYQTPAKQVSKSMLAIGLGSINAQDNLRWGVTAGMNVSSLNVTGLDSRVGFHAGVKAELGLPQFTEGLYMDFGALLSLKGAKVEAGSMASFKINPYYLEIPVHIGYKYAVNDNFSVFANAGPYIAIGLFGKAKMTADGSLVDGGSKVSESENVFGDDGFKRFDLGLGLKAGIEISKKYQFSIGYDFGFIEAEELMGCKNRNLMISLGLMF